MTRSTTSLSILRGILAGPVPLLGRAIINADTSSSLMCVMIRSTWLRFLRNFSGEMLGTFGTFFSVSGPTLTKKFFHLH